MMTLLYRRIADTHGKDRRLGRIGYSGHTAQGRSSPLDRSDGLATDNDGWGGEVHNYQYNYQAVLCCCGYHNNLRHRQVSVAGSYCILVDDNG